MRFDEFVGGIQVDGIPFLDHISFSLEFSVVIERFVIGDKLFEGFIGMLPFQFVKLIQTK